MPETGILQAVYLLCIGKAVSSGEAVHIGKPIPVVMIPAQIPDQFVCCFIITYLNHLIQQPVDRICFFQCTVIDLFHHSSHDIELDQTG